MALNLDLLSATAAGRGKALWLYGPTADTAANIVGAGYFNTAADRLKPGDVIFAQTDTGTTAVTKVHSVISNNGTTVVVTAAA